MKKAMIIITSLLAISLMATYSFAGTHGKDTKHNFSKDCIYSDQGHKNNSWQNLSNEQKTQLKTLHQKFIDETYETRSDLLVKHQQMRMLMETSSPDKAQIKSLSQAVIKLKGQMQNKRIDYQLAAKKIAPELNVSHMGDRHDKDGRDGRDHKNNCNQ
ncbi:MAG: periplasmic heavy metal sensor [Desulfobacteraceae bacterium]|nr:periplasmic heavy metal sensor [Desulfobacteraceae bacterium]